MNIEIADRLVDLRKQHGLSQEELAARLGVSRQAVSKWERAESSPDTDNLIRLAQLYQISLDDMLRIQPAARPAPEPPAPEPQVDLRVRPDPPEQSPPEDFPTIDMHPFPDFEEPIARQPMQTETRTQYEQPYVADYSETDPAYRPAGASPTAAGMDYRNLKRFLLRFPYPVVVVMVYLALGFLFGAWHPSWLLFLTIPLYYPLAEGFCHAAEEGFTRASIRRLLLHFPFPVVVAMLFLVVGFFFGWWHPAWMLFLTIPIYYCVVSTVS